MAERDAKRARTEDAEEKLEERRTAGGRGGGRGGGAGGRGGRAQGDAGLSHLVDCQISVVTNDGRVIVGVLRGYDQATNVILDESHERVFSSKAGVESVVLGLQIIRGDNIAVVGELDAERDASLDLAKIQAAPLKAVVH